MTAIRNKRAEKTMQDMGMGPDSYPRPDRITHSPERLTVSDVVKLAQAGVKIDFNEVAKQIIPDPVVERNPYDHQVAPSVQLILDRWNSMMRARQAFNSSVVDQNFFEGRALPWRYLNALPCGETVYVTIVPMNGPLKPVVWEDPAHLFPSDGLFAHIELMLKSLPPQVNPLKQASAGQSLGGGNVAAQGAHGSLSSIRMLP